MNAIKDIAVDVCVVGGGLAGVFAAVSAARNGVRAALVQDRSVLGGNASSELNIGIAGADCSGAGLVRYARETGLIDEYMLEVLDRSHGAAASRPLFSIVLWEMVKREPNLSLFMNTYVHRARTGDQGEITSVEAFQTNTETAHRFYSKMFIDCTGHGTVGAAAGAEFRMGREGKEEFNESMAPDQPDSRTMGDSIVFRARNLGRLIPYVAPDWAERFPTDDDLPYRHPETRETEDGEIVGFWWLEYGGDRNTITDAQEIHEQLLRILFGLWDHMKNAGDHGVDNYALTHIDIIPGRRESRRLIGDIIVSENDVRNATAFDDRIAYAGWPIDVHPPEGIYSPEPPCTHVHLPRVWSIPFRSIYSRNVPNLMFAGRDISVSHIALGSSRVMGTCAVIGQAAGTAAAMCCRGHVTPRQLGRDRIHELQQQLLKDDCYLEGIRNEDQDDLARTASVSATSLQRLAVPEVHDFCPLDKACAQMVPVSEARIDEIILYLRSVRTDSASVRLALHQAGHINDFTSTRIVAESTVVIGPMYSGWVTSELGAEVEPNRFHWVSLEATPGISWAYQRELVLATNCASNQPGGWPQWRAFPREPLDGGFLRTFCIRLTPESSPYQPGNVVSGVSRPEQWTNIWVSDSSQAMPQHIDLAFSEPRKVHEIRLTFDDDLDTNIYHPRPFGRLGHPGIETLIRDYRVYTREKRVWTERIGVTNNHQRCRVHALDGLPVEAVRVDCLSTHGSPQARIYEVRIY